MRNEMQVIMGAGNYVGRLFNAGANLLSSREFMAGAVAAFALAAQANASPTLAAAAARLAAQPEAGNAPVAQIVQQKPAQVASLQPSAPKKRQWAGVIDGPKPY